MLGSRPWFGLILSLPLALASLPAPALAAGEEKPALTIGIVPYYSPDKMYQLWTPVVDYLNRKTPFTWAIKLGESHDQLVEGLCRGDLHVGYLGPVPLGKALNKCGVKPLLISLGLDGQPTYQAVLVTTDPSVRLVGDLRGRKLGIFEKSTASHYLPLRMLADAGVRREEVEVVNLPSQDRIIAAVLANQVAAGGVKETLFRSFADQKLRALASSVPLPQFSFCAGSSLPPEAEKAFVSALLALHPSQSAADRELLKGWDPELSNGVVVPPADFGDQLKALLRSVEPFLR